MVDIISLKVISFNLHSTVGPPLNDSSTCNFLTLMMVQNQYTFDRNIRGILNLGSSSGLVIRGTMLSHDAGRWQ